MTVLSRKAAAANLVKALRVKGMKVTVDGSRMAVTAHLDGSSQTVVLRGNGDDARWCVVWEPFRTEEKPEIEPLLPVGQEWVLASRLAGILALARIKV